MGISIGALLFVRDRSSKNARRMFHGSLIYLPLFMSGLLLHRVPNEQNETIMAEPTRNDEVLTEVVASEGSSYKKRKDRMQTRPPIAYASVAPFPFLPAPMYDPSDS